MGNEKPAVGPDGLPAERVSFYPASPEQMQTYRDAQTALDSFRARLEPLVSADNPHQKLFVAAFDSTGSDQFDDSKRKTNVAKIDNQIKALNNPQIHAEYLAGPGTQANPIARTLDAAFGYTSPDLVERMYVLAVETINDWHRADPDVDVRFGSLGFSRGGAQAAAFANVLQARGIPDLDSRIVAPDGSFTYARYLIEPGQVRQALGLFDPVATGGPMTLDRRPSPSLHAAFQLSALDEQRALFPADMVLPPGASEDGRLLHLQVAGAHSDIGGGHARDGLAIRNGNLMIDFCNSLCDRPFLQRLPEHDAPHLNVVHRSEESMLLYQVEPKASRLSPEGVNLHLTPTDVDPRLATRAAWAGAGTGLGAAGLAAAAYEGVQTYDHYRLLQQQGNPLAAQSASSHYIARMIGGWAGGSAGALLGSGAGPGGLVAGGVAGGVLGERTGERIAAGMDAAKVYTQTDRDGVQWAFDGRVWQREGKADLSQGAIGDPQDIKVAASLDKARELNAQASRIAVALAMGETPTPRNPHQLPANDRDRPSLRAADWQRNPDTGHWQRNVAVGLERSSERMVYESETASPQRAAALERQSAQVVWQNIASGPAAIAAQYQIEAHRSGFSAFDGGQLPEAVRTALSPERLRASDGALYARNASGAWMRGDNHAQGHLALELETTRGLLQVSLAEHQQRLAAMPSYAERTPQDLQREHLVYQYRVIGTELEPDWAEAIELARARTRAQQGLTEGGGTHLMRGHGGRIGADSPIAHLQADADGVGRIVAVTAPEDIRAALKDVRTRNAQAVAAPAATLDPATVRSGPESTQASSAPIAADRSTASMHALQQALQMQRQAAEDRQAAAARDNERERVRQQDRAQTKTLDYSHPDSPEHTLYARLAQRLDGRGQLDGLSQAQLVAMAGRMHRNGFKADWEGDAIVRHGRIMARDMHNHWADLPLSAQVPSPEQTMREVQAEDLRMAQAAEAARQQELMRPPPGPGQPGGPPLP